MDIADKTKASAGHRHPGPRDVVADHDHSIYLDRAYLKEAAAQMSLEVPERVLFAGDIHGELSALQWLARRAANAEISVILQAGDFGYWPHTDPRFIAKADKICEAAGVHIVFIDGNHENFAALYAEHPTYEGFRVIGRRILHAPRGLVWEWQGKRILAFGGAASIDIIERQAEERAANKPHKRARWRWWPEENITDAEVARASAAGDVDIVLCHDCPESVGLPSEAHQYAIPAARASRKQVQRVIAATHPRLIVHGHYHLRYSGIGGGIGWAARVEGLGRDGMKEASCIELDLREPLSRPL